MTISTSQSAVTGIGNGVTTAFDFNFVMGTASNAVVTYVNDGIFTVLNSSQYTLFINEPAANQIWGVGGTVTYPISGPPIPDGAYLIIDRIVPLTQVTSISNQGDFYPQVIEAALDTLEMQIQQIANGQYALFVTTSLTSQTIGTGVYTFIVANSNLAYTPGQFLIISANGNPSESMTGYIVSYTNFTLVINITDTGTSSGTYSAWNISISGLPGLTGQPGNVTGTTASTDGDIVLYNGSTGQQIRDGGNGTLNGNLTVNGMLTVNLNSINGISYTSTQASGFGNTDYFWEPSVPALGTFSTSYLAKNASGISTLMAGYGISVENITTGSETAIQAFDTIQAGVYSNKINIGAGLYGTGLVDEGVNTINMNGYYLNGTLLILQTKASRLTYQLASGTNSATFTASTWTISNLNTKIYDDIGLTLASNQIVGLPAGTYEVDANACFNVSNGQNGVARIRLFNVTAGAEIADTVSNSVNSLAPTIVDCTITPIINKARFTIGGTSTIELQYYNSQTSAVVATSSGDVEIYADLYIKKIA